jgi:hypothetical protein
VEPGKLGTVLRCKEKYKMIYGLTKKQEKILAKRERNDAAFHEAGHLIALTLFGGVGRARIWKNPKRAHNQKAWLGHMCTIGEPGKVTHEPDPESPFQIITPLPARWRVIIGMAGFVAERMAAGDTDPLDIYHQLDHAIDFLYLSATDIKAIGDDWEYEDVVSTIVLLSSHWKLVELEAKHMAMFAE